MKTVEGRQRSHRETKGDKPGNLDERIRRETKANKPGNHAVAKSVSLQELRTPSAEAVLGNVYIQ